MADDGCSSHRNGFQPGLDTDVGGTLPESFLVRGLPACHTKEIGPAPLEDAFSEFP